MTNWFDKKRLAEQLKFFGASKQGFISCYAKKPRIKVAIKSTANPSKVVTDEYLRALCQNQIATAQAGIGQAVMGNQLAGVGNRYTLFGGLGLGGFI